MAKERRSFFERLTGAAEMPEVEEVEERRPTLAKSPDTSEWLGEEDEGQLAVDVFQTPDDIVIKAMVAGVKPEDLDVSITRDMVTIRGVREGASEVSEDNFIFKELYWGTFSRTILLPQEIEVEESIAEEKHGLLTIRMPKVDKGKQTKLKVRTS